MYLVESALLSLELKESIQPTNENGNVRMGGLRMGGWVAIGYMQNLADAFMSKISLLGTVVTREIYKCSSVKLKMKTLRKLRDGCASNDKS